jgi:N-acyl-D-aspartate/D-glutamate deacylase
MALNVYDTIIEGGSVIDGTGADAYVTDIGIKDERIAAIGDLSSAQAAMRHDCQGLTVAPGFIDIHTHSDYTLLVDGRADSQICQGVTTEVIGQCGFSCAPLKRAAGARAVIGYVELGMDVTWRTFGEYLDRLEQARPAVNVAAFVGHGAIHRAVMGDGAKTPTESDLSEMVKLVEQAFDDGAKGLSTGLEYWPGSDAPMQELEALTAVAAKRGGLYATHVRNRDVYYDLGFTEAVATARHAGAKLQISHIQPKFGAPSEAMQHTLELLYRAKREGVDVGYDIIPHDWSHTVMVSVLPAWAREGGVTQTLARLKDPIEREHMKHNPRPIWRLVTERQWHDIVLLKSRVNAELIGLSFAEIGERRGVDPYDAVFDILLEEGQDMAAVMWTSRNFSDDDVCMCLRETDSMVMSDTLALTDRGPLNGTIGSLSGYGWTARLLGHYVRDRQVISLPEAITKITSKPADRIGLAVRGRIEVGAMADVVAFDAGAVQDRSSFFMPRRHPDGITHVWVNGVQVVHEGQRNDEQPGRVLRH